MKKLTNMIDVGGMIYYINFDALDKLITTDDTLSAQDVSDIKTKEFIDVDGKVYKKIRNTSTYRKSKEIDGARYDCMGLMLQIIMNTDVEIDDTLGVDRGLAEMPLNWKIAFNTLQHYGILVTIEE